MAERWVINASPLIVLAKIEHLHLIPALADEFVIPDTVITEIQNGPDGDAARRYVESNVPTAEVIPQREVLAWDLGAGETGVLSFAIQNPGWKAVVDDGLARRCARTLSIPLIGTLGIVIRAKQAGLIPAAGPVLKATLDHGFHLDKTVIRHVLEATVGEAFE